MDLFKQYLQKAKAALKNLENFTKIYIVLGNESADMDSTVSALVYGYFLSQSCDKKTLVLPIVNVTSEQFLLRMEACYTLQEHGIDLLSLVYRDGIDFNSLIQSKKNISTTLVDHHILSTKDAILENTVEQIFDHRPKDKSCKWKEDVKLKIEDVGSCATLIANEIRQNNEKIWCKELAQIVYNTIIYDTIGVLPKWGKTKDLDIEIVEYIEEKFGINKNNRQTLYEKLWEVHTDVSHLTPIQLLYKDLKIVDNNPVPGLPMLVDSFLKLPGSVEAIQKFAKDFDSSVVILIGLSTKSEVLRDIGIYFTDTGVKIKDKLLDRFRCSSNNGCDFKFGEAKLCFENIVVLSQGNVSLSRKQIIPLLKELDK